MAKAVNIIHLRNCFKHSLIYHQLFLDIRKPSDNELEMFHRQAEISIDNLIRIRSEWDHFISNSSDKSRAESIPVNWIEPNQTPNEEWYQFARTNQPE